MGHRIAKHVYNNLTGILEKRQRKLVKTSFRQTLVRKERGTTYYVLDAQGEKALLLKTESLSGKTESSREMSVYERVAATSKTFSEFPCEI